MGDWSRTRRASLAALVTVLALPLAAGVASAEPPVAPATVTAAQAVPVQQVADSFGWNTHWSYYDRVYSRFDDLMAPIRELGVRHMRDGVPYNDDLMTKYRALCADGVRFTLSTDWNTDFAALPGILKELGVPCVEAVAAQNEPNLFRPPGGGDWAAAAREQQQNLYDTINGDPALADIPVFSVSPTGDVAALGDISASADYCDIHPYGSYHGLTWDDPYSSIYRALERAAPYCGDLPPVATEVGFHTALEYDTSVDKHFPTSELAMSRMMPRAVVSYFNAGLRIHYNYELVDQGTAPHDKEGSFGTFRNDLSPKPAADTMRRLAGLLADTGAAFTPGTLGYGLTGDTENIETLLAQRADGTFVLLMQANDPVWDQNARTDIEPAARQVTLTLGTAALATVRSVNSDEPLSTTTGTEVPLTVGADLLAVEIGASATPPASPSPTPTPTATIPPPEPIAASPPVADDWLAQLVDRISGLLRGLFGSPPGP